MSSNGRLKENLQIPRIIVQPASAADLNVVDLSVVVVSYNTAALLRRCLASVYANPHPHYRFEVLVVDNASGDGSAALVEREFPQARLIANPQNLGFAAASNQALAQARGTYLLLLNPDTEVMDDALWKMVDFLEQEPQAAVVGPALLYPDHSFQEGAFGFPGLWQLFFDFFPLNWRLTRSRLNGRYPRRLFEGVYPQAFEVDFPLGACLMVRRSVVERIGLLDEAFFMYMEEIDWCYRIKELEIPSSYRPVGLRFRAGRRRPSRWRVYCFPAAKIIHHAGASTRQFREEMTVELYKSRYHFFHKHYSHRFQTAARLIIRGSLAVKMSGLWLGQLSGRLTRAEAASRRRAYRRIWRLG